METNNYCIVGYGKHSSTKLIPALEKLNKNIFGIVTSKVSKIDKKYNYFNNLDEAIEKSSPNSIFIISTPPLVHFKQIKTILNAKRNIFVEKPIFVSTKEALIIKNILLKEDLFVVESMMFKHSILYKKFFDYWLKYKKSIIKLECTFLIPSIPLNTFRDGLFISSSPLYDIGCYIISLLIDLGFKLDNLQVNNVLFKRSKVTKIIINNSIDNIELLLNFGLGKEYKNSIKLFTENKKYVEFSPFFYGRAGEKKISHIDNDVINEIFIDDFTAFELMFEIPKDIWILNQKKRFINIIKVNSVLESLSNQITQLKFN